MTSHRVEIIRRNNDSGSSQIKDPSIVQDADGGYYMYATFVTDDFNGVGRFHAAHPGGPWQELAPATITGVEGPEVVAPAVVRDGDTWTMYVQTSCFSKDGVIAVATSADGVHFTGTGAAAASKDGLPGVIGVYDVAVSDVTEKGAQMECMVFSGYRAVGNGDVYVALREKGADAWSAPVLALKQEDVPFHNPPGSRDYEWGLEGAKVVQLADDAYLMIGVAFLDKSVSERGTRQRVFFAASNKPEGPYTAMETPYAPTAYPEGTGENGHPDTIDLGNKIGVLYQERAGEGQPWHLRYTEEDKQDLLSRVRAALAPKPASPRIAPPTP